LAGRTDHGRIGIANMGDNAIIAARETPDVLFPSTIYSDNRDIQSAIGAVVTFGTRIRGGMARVLQQTQARHGDGAFQKIAALQKRQHGIPSERLWQS